MWFTVVLVLSSAFMLGSFVLDWDRLTSYSVDVCLFGNSWSDYFFTIIFDNIFFSLFFMLLICGLSAVFYCSHYFSGSYLDAKHLKFLIIFFLGVMFFLVSSGNFLFSLVCWEYLGFVSFLLILFYTNSVGLRASLITLASSRLGDVGLFLVFGTWLGGFNFEGGVLSLCLGLVVLTKSACYPLVAWLVEAMRAPTPVSSLVHSSTLVAAGVWFLLRYGYCLGEGVLWCLYFCSLVTILVSGFCALGFSDIKKVVAFSTCSNISWCVLLFVAGDVFLAGMQLLVHGLCKCMLFMVVGDLMSSSDSSQDVASLHPGNLEGGYLVFVRSFLVFCLCGLPFCGLFFTKHSFLGFCCFSLGLFYSILLFVGLGLTCAYSMRLYCMLFSSYSGLSWGVLNNFLLVFVLCFLGTLVGWGVSGVIEEVCSVSSLFSVFILGVQISGLFWGLIVYESGLFSVLWAWVGRIWGTESLICSVYSFFCGGVGVLWFFLFRWEVFLMKSLLGWSPSSVYRFYSYLGGVGCMCFGLSFVLFIYWVLL